MSAISRDKDKRKVQTPSRERMYSTEGMKYIKCLLKLKHQETIMEKNLVNLMEKMTLEPEISQLLLHNVNDVSSKRQILLDGIKRSLEDVIEEMRSVKSIMDHPEVIQKLDTKAYRQRLVRLSQKFQDLKESCQLESLSQEQTSLESELREFELNLHRYKNATGSIGKPTSITFFNKENKGCHDHKEIQDFHALIARTGHTDNWTNEDHTLFLKMRKKCNSIPALVVAMQVKCPDLTTETVVNHEAWYKMYLKLREEQRSSIKVWRKRKEEEKLKKVRDNEADDLTEIFPEEKDFNITGKYPNRVSNKCKIKVMKADNAIDVKITKKKELINRWKIEKENKRSMDEEQSKIQMKSKLAAQEKRRKERLKRMHEALVDYRRKKSMETSSKSLKHNSREVRKYDSTLFKIFRKQDDEYMMRRKSLILDAKKSTCKNQMVKPRVTARQSYSSTLFNTTEVWRERCKIEESETKESKRLQYIKDVPRLYIRWRNKESPEIQTLLRGRN